MKGRDLGLLGGRSPRKCEIEKQRVVLSLLRRNIIWDASVYFQCTLGHSDVKYVVWTLLSELF